jgi:hypothetical protein
MKKYIIYILIILAWTATVHAQQTVDSTKIENPVMQTPVDSTAVQSAETAPEDTVKIPLFDFRPQPVSHLRGMYRDSTLLFGSRYTSFGDVLDWLPGGYYANLGSSGQTAFGSLFGAPVGEFLLEYDGLILNNPFSGAVDLNLVPTESIGNVGLVHSPLRPFGYLPIGGSMHIRAMDIADNPIRSQVGYRYGYYGSDDVDVRVGVRASERLWMNFGGLIKGYTGIVPNQEYSGNKINFSLNRRLGPNWLAKYIVLFNQRDTEVPLPAALPQLPEFINPRQKDRRTDHSLQFYYKLNFKTLFQFTKLEQDFHAQQRSVFDERHNAYAYRLISEINGKMGFASWNAGMTGSATWLNSNNWGKQSEWQAQAYSNLSGRLTSTFEWLAGMRAQEHEDYSPQVLPEMNLFYTADSTLRFSAWANRVATFPSLQAKYANGPFALGNKNLAKALYDQIGIAGEKQFENLFIHGSAVFQQRNNQIAALFADEESIYANLPNHNIVNFNALFDYSFLKDLRFVFKGDYFKILEDEPVVSNRPEYYLKSFLQYHLVQFKGDLNARLRAGTFILGERQGPLPFYAETSTLNTIMKPAIYPYFHAVLIYRSAEIFFAYENYIDADVQYVYGYSMPSMWLRYGFVWHFVD